MRLSDTALNRVSLSFVRLAALCMAVFIGFVFSAAATSAATFQTPPTTVSVDAPSAAITADFDGEGTLDLVVINEAANSISISLNPGNGTFDSFEVYAAGANLIRLTGLDVDGDEDLDILGYNSTAFVIFRNNGQGEFSATLYSIGNNIAALLQVADFDQDGSLDLYHSSYGQDNAWVWLNDGNGTFTSSTYASASNGNPYSITAGDITDDTYPDIILHNDATDNISVLINDGDGTFASAVNYASGNGTAYTSHIADLDDDGDADFIGGNYYATTVSVLLNDGDGTFATSSHYGFGGAEGVSYSKLADVDGDGDFDFIGTVYGEDRVVVVFNDGDGDFGVYDEYSVTAAGAAFHPFIEDLDGDGDIDIVVSIHLAPEVTVLLNDGTGTFSLEEYELPSGYAVNLAFGDLDGDGDLELVAPAFAPDAVFVFFSSVYEPDPSLSTMNPSSAAAGSSGFTMTLTGSGFVASSTVYFNGTPRTTTYVNANTLTASILTGDLATAGTYPVLVYNSSFIGGGTSTADTFTVHAAVGGAGSGGGGLSSSGSGGSSALPPLVTTFQTNLQNLQNQGVSVHGLIKIPSNSAVYYVGSDGKRHAFPNDKVYFTWYENFDGVQLVNEAQLSSIPLGKNVTYKPGKKMVKFTTDNKVYVVAKGGILRWVTTEEAAIALYGSSWNMQIDDISDAFYTNYTFGNNVSGLSGFNPTTVQASVQFPSDSLEM